MSKIVYGKRDTKTVVSIEHAPQSIQTLWNQANSLGVNIVRVRANKERYETTTGDTFEGYHSGTLCKANTSW
jgi:glycine cleavage system pyridoxal-binding protein P